MTRIMVGANLFFIFLILLFATTLSQSEYSSQKNSKDIFLPLNKCKTTRDTLNYYKANVKVNMALIDLHIKSIDELLGNKKLIKLAKGNHK